MSNYVLLVIFASLLCICASYDNRYPYIRDLWTKADDILPSYDQKSLEEQWKQIDRKMHEVSGSMFDLGQEMMTKYHLDMPAVSKKCVRSLFDVFTSFMRLEPWAYMMLGSSGIIPSGFGSGVSFGNYDICVNVKGKKSIVGNYCKLELMLPFPKIGAYIARNKDLPLPVNFTVPHSLTNMMAEILHPYYYFAYTIVSVCIPSQCSAHDVQEIANTIVDFIDINATARSIGCQVKEPIRFNIYDLVATCTLSVAIILCIVGTIIHCRKKNRDEFDKDEYIITRVLDCFSVQKSNTQLFKSEKRNIYQIFSGLQFLTLVWIVVFHSHWFIPLNLYGSTVPIGRPIVPFNFETVRNAFFGFDTLFFISAALLMYHRLQDSNKHIGVAQYVIAKVLRLSPGLIFVTAIAIVSRHLSNGPLWKEVVDPISRRCEKNWWTNVLFVNNYVTSSEQCLIWSWYAATEMQLFLVSFLVLIPLRRKPKLGLYILVALLGIGIAATIANHVGYDLPPTVVLSALFYPDDFIYFMDHILYPSYLHLTSCCLGLAVGYFIYKKPLLQFSNWMSNFAYVISCTVGFTIVCSVHSWNIGHAPPNVIYSTLYSVTCKLIWCLVLGWITVTCVTNRDGKIHSFLTWKGFVPLGRLVYMAYLLHPLIILLYAGSVRYPIQADSKTMTFLGFGLGIGVLIATYVCFILFEAPFLAISQSFLFNDEQEEELTENISDKKMISISTVNIVHSESDKEHLTNKDIIGGKPSGCPLGKFCPSDAISPSV